MIYFATCGVVRREMRKKTFPSNFRFSPRRKNFLHHWRIWILNGSLLSKKWLRYIFFFFPISMDMLSWDLINESESKTNFIFLRSYRFFLLTHNDVDDKKWETLSISLPYFLFLVYMLMLTMETFVAHFSRTRKVEKSYDEKKKKSKLRVVWEEKWTEKSQNFFRLCHFHFHFDSQRLIYAHLLDEMFRISSRLFANLGLFIETKLYLPQEYELTSLRAVWENYYNFRSTLTLAQHNTWRLPTIQTQQQLPGEQSNGNSAQKLKSVFSVWISVGLNSIVLNFQFLNFRVPLPIQSQSNNTFDS